MNKLQMIAVSDIYPHPQNPRKDLGDLTELTASIKENGIFQNLTVVKRDEGGYTAVIGHRRLAAATAAGLDKVPCAVVKMSEQEQLETMLVENINRSDLTVYEQAEGFQLLLDFGSSIEEVAKTSGFSESTVRRRVKLLELDKEKFRSGVEQGATLDDFAQLDKIKDINRKNEALEHIGTPNFANAVYRAIEAEEHEEKLNKLCEQVVAFAEEIESGIGEEYEYVDSYYVWQNLDVETPEDADDVDYYYTKDSNGVTIYKYKQKTEISTEEAAKRIAEEKQEKILRARINETQSAGKKIIDKQIGFIKQLVAEPKRINKNAVCEFVSLLILKGFIYFNISDKPTLLNLCGLGEDSVDDRSPQDVFIEVFQKEEGVVKLLSVAAAYMPKMGIPNLYFLDWWDDTTSNKIKCNKLIDELSCWLSLLETHGYIPSKMEEAYFAGKYAEYAGWEDIDNEKQN